MFSPTGTLLLKIQPHRAFYFYGAISKSLDMFNRISWSSRGAGLRAEEHRSAQRVCSFYFIATSFTLCLDHSEKGAGGEQPRPVEEEIQRDAESAD